MQTAVSVRMCGLLKLQITLVSGVMFARVPLVGNKSKHEIKKKKLCYKNLHTYCMLSPVGIGSFAAGRQFDRYNRGDCDVLVSCGQVRARRPVSF